jgi:hypothetical protein
VQAECEEGIVCALCRSAWEQPVDDYVARTEVLKVFGPPVNGQRTLCDECFEIVMDWARLQ